jgi:Tfp pilus assembly protein PilF
MVVVSAQEPNANPPPGAPPAAPTPKLSKEDVNRLSAIIAEVQQLVGRKHYLDALLKLDEADAIAPNSAAVWNVRGSVYTSYRDFDKARDAFTKARAAAPQAFEPQFNLAELLYVEHKYEDAEEAFTQIIKSFPKLREEPRHLTLFKILICRLKQNKANEAADIMKNFTATDDTPAYYYSQAVIPFNAGKRDEAALWMDKAAHIFTEARNAVYLDAINEAQWMKPLTPPKKEE